MNAQQKLAGRMPAKGSAAAAEGCTLVRGLRVAFRKLLVGSIVAATLLVAAPTDAFASGGYLPYHEVSTNASEICVVTNVKLCTIGVQLPTKVCAWDRTTARDYEAVQATVRFYLYLNNRWVQYDQGWAIAPVYDNACSTPNWVYTASSSTSLSTSSMSIQNVTPGTYYMVEVWIRWPSTGQTASHRGPLSLA
jgi:hypothetical protein